ncbi:hypothetical protein SAMN05421847_0917 [Halpernia humi]|uniref:Uncharacterized protein n=1 Tax=Halpernia humi TaxID=493375 RepID=A0A1H5UTS9_9FLAO|nr:hypothetical protein SAMN05421847_0917 [Halpernia humi]
MINVLVLILKHSEIYFSEQKNIPTFAHPYWVKLCLIVNDKL